MYIQSGSNDCGQEFSYTSGSCTDGIYPYCKTNYRTGLGDVTQQCR
jgi:hypothetical protein